MDELISVIIPVYNTKKTLLRCIQSVLNQSYRNFEIILMDDGSWDASSMLCDIQGIENEENAIYIIHTVNGGPSKARNSGIDFASGKYIVFIDSDDTVNSSYLYDFMQMRRDHPEVGHIWCGFQCTSGTNVKYIYSDSEPVSITDRSEYMTLSEKVLVQSPWLRLYDAEILNRYKIRMMENISLAEDILFNMDYLDAVPCTEVCIINKPNYRYCDNNTSSLKNKYRSNLYEINAVYLDRLEQYLQKWGLTDQTSQSKYHTVVFMKYCNVFDNTMSKNNDCSLYQRILENNRIMRDSQFVAAVDSMDMPISSLERKMYLSGNYFWIWIWELLKNLRRYLR